MAHFVLKKRSGKFRPYLFLGPDFKIPIASKNVNTVIYPSHSDFSFDIGIGLEKAFTRFIFAPELRYSYSSFKWPHSQEIKKVNIHSLSLLLSFRG